MIAALMGPSINDVSLRGREGVKNVRIYLEKRRQRGREGGHKIRKMGRRRLWMSPYRPSERVLALDKTPLKRKYDDDIY